MAGTRFIVPRLLEVFLRFLRLGVTAFGGPIAHLGYFRREFVAQAAWLDDEAFTEIVALCSVLPGPTSSQVGMLLGAKRAGPFGALAAWTAFTFPSAFFLAVAGWLLRSIDQDASHGWFTFNRPISEAIVGVFRNHPWLYHPARAATVSLAFTAYAVVLLAVITLARATVRTPFARIFVGVAFAVSLAALTYAPSYSWIALAVGAIAGAAYAPRSAVVRSTTPLHVSRAIGIGSFAVLAGALAVLFALPSEGYGKIFATAFRAGSLVFGGGHVVLGFLTPLVGRSDVPIGEFQTGYGLTQGMPGPLFAFASFLGAADTSTASSFFGAFVGIVGIFLPSFLILPAALALWSSFREAPRAGAILAGLNVAVVGLLAATFVDLLRVAFAHVQPFPIRDAGLGVVAFALLAIARCPAWAVVLAMALGAAAFTLVANALHVPYYFQIR